MNMNVDLGDTGWLWLNDRLQESVWAYIDYLSSGPSAWYRWETVLALQVLVLVLMSASKGSFILGSSQLSAGYPDIDFHLV